MPFFEGIGVTVSSFFFFETGFSFLAQMIKEIFLLRFK